MVLVLLQFSNELLKKSALLLESLFIITGEISNLEIVNSIKQTIKSISYSLYCSLLNNTTVKSRFI